MTHDWRITGGESSGSVAVDTALQQKAQTRALDELLNPKPHKVAADAFTKWMRRVDERLTSLSEAQHSTSLHLDELDSRVYRSSENLADHDAEMRKRIDMLEGNQRAVITPAHNDIVRRVTELETKLPDNTLNRRDVGRLVRAARKVRSWWVGEPDTKGGVEILGELKAAIEAFEGDYK